MIARSPSEGTPTIVTRWSRHQTSVWRSKIVSGIGAMPPVSIVAFAPPGCAQHADQHPALSGGEIAHMARAADLGDARVALDRHPAQVPAGANQLSELHAVQVLGWIGEDVSQEFSGCLAGGLTLDATLPDGSHQPHAVGLPERNLPPRLPLGRGSFEFLRHRSRTSFDREPCGEGTGPRKCGLPDFGEALHHLGP